MKKTYPLLLSVLILGFALVPAASLAYLGTSDVPYGGMPMMNSLSGSEWEEMQGFMTDMARGELEAEDVERMTEIMNEHHDDFAYGPNGSYMMPMMAPWSGWTGNYGFGYWLMIITSLVWLLVGLLLATFLIKKLNK